MISKYLSKKKGRFYAGFVDFSRGFHGICHNLLFHQLMKSGIHGHILKVIRSMYEQLKPCVRTGNGLLVGLNVSLTHVKAICYHHCYLYSTLMNLLNY